MGATDANEDTPVRQLRRSKFHSLACHVRSDVCGNDASITTRIARVSRSNDFVFLIRDARGNDQHEEGIVWLFRGSQSARERDGARLRGRRFAKIAGRNGGDDLPEFSRRLTARTWYIRLIIALKQPFVRMPRDGVIARERQAARRRVRTSERARSRSQIRRERPFLPAREKENSLDTFGNR